MSKLRSRFGRYIKPDPESETSQVQLVNELQPQAQINDTKELLTAKFRSILQSNSEPTPGQIRDLYSQSVGLLDPNCDFYRYRFLISDSNQRLDKLAEFFSHFFVQANSNTPYLDPNSSHMLDMLESEIVVDASTKDQTSLKALCFMAIMTKLISFDRFDAGTEDLERQLKELTKLELKAVSERANYVELAHWINQIVYLLK